MTFFASSEGKFRPIQMDQAEIHPKVTVNSPSLIIDSVRGTDVARDPKFIEPEPISTVRFSQVFAQGVQRRRDRLEFAFGNANCFGLFQAVTGEIAHDHVVPTDHA